MRRAWRRANLRASASCSRFFLLSSSLLFNLSNCRRLCARRCSIRAILRCSRRSLAVSGPVGVRSEWSSELVDVDGGFVECGVGGLLGASGDGGDGSGGGGTFGASGDGGDG